MYIYENSYDNYVIFETFETFMKMCTHPNS